MKKPQIDEAERRRRQQERSARRKQVFAAMSAFQESHNPRLKRGHLKPQ